MARKLSEKTLPVSNELSKVDVTLISSSGCKHVAHLSKSSVPVFLLLKPNISLVNISQVHIQSLCKFNSAYQVPTLLISIAILLLSIALFNSWTICFLWLQSDSVPIVHIGCLSLKKVSPLILNQ